LSRRKAREAERRGRISYFEIFAQGDSPWEIIFVRMHQGATGWELFDDGSTMGKQGSEGGMILLDEEYSSGARMTLERDGATAPFTITCGVYGWMVHTRFFATEGDARDQFKEMKDSLADILSAIPKAKDSEGDTHSVSEALGHFILQYP